MTSVNQEPPKQDPPGLITSPDASADLLANSLSDYVRIVARRIRSGESGALPVIIGLVVVVIYFQARNSLFLSPLNLVNLLAQSSFIITLGMAEIFVLLLGDIDLAAGFTAACGAVVALWMLALGDPWWAAVLVALAGTAVYGALQGFIIAWLRIPSFVVTLAGQLALSGVLLVLIDAAGSIGNGGVISLQSSIINDIENGHLNPTATWIVMIAVTVAAGAVIFYGDLRRRSAWPGRPAGLGLAAQGGGDRRRRHHRRVGRGHQPRPGVPRRRGHAVGRARRARDPVRLDYPAWPY